MASSRLAIGVFATSDWRSLQQRAALPVFQRMLLSGKTRLTDCSDRERVSFTASQLRNSHVKKLDNISLDSALFCKFNDFTRQFHWFCSANSLILVSNFIDFTLPSRWDLGTKELLHVSNESRSSHQNKLICNRICHIFARNICFSIYYTDVLITLNYSL